MAKLKLESNFRKRLNNAMAERLTHIGLAKSTESPSTSSMNNTQASGYLCGDAEILALSWESNADYIKNSLNNSPLLIFTVADTQQPKQYHLFYVDGANYYRDVTITTVKPTATFDTAVQLASLKIEIKGDNN